jgi:hypothetical protein
MVVFMPRIRWTRGFVFLGVVAALVGCRDILKAEKSNYVIINVETLKTGATTYGARPSGLFFNAAGIFLSSSFVSRDSCIIQRFPPDITNPNLDYLDAGDGVLVKFERPQTQGTLLPHSQGTVESYVLPEGTSIPFVPGDTVKVEVPGNGETLEPVTIVARTAEVFTPGALTLPGSNQTDMPVSWTPGATAVPGSAMFYSLRYAAPATTTLNREIACFFVDDGSAAIPFEALFEFRESTVRNAKATRIRIVANRTGNTVTHLTSTFTADVPITP